jgi:hypothetical protein
VIVKVGWDLHYILFNFSYLCVFNTGWHTKWPSIWSINKICISITILGTNIQKERPLHGDLCSVNQVFNMTTITSGNFFNTNCDVDYSPAHILSYLRPEW